MDIKRLVLVGCLLLVIILCVQPILNDMKYDGNVESINASLNPIQTQVDEFPFDYEGKKETFVIKPLASYEISAQVLSKKRYYFDTFAKVAPYDLALGWGKALEPNNLKHVKYSQSSRWYFFRVRDIRKINMTLAQIDALTANTHVIPANKHVLYGLKKIDEGDIIQMKGFLVSVKGDGLEVTSSMSRTDSGGGACEVMYVTYLATEYEVYE